jgi:hypothetical protein
MNVPSRKGKGIPEARLGQDVHSIKLLRFSRSQNRYPGVMSHGAE